jgi:hypothetical protein
MSEETKINLRLLISVIYGLQVGRGKNTEKNYHTYIVTNNYIGYHKEFTTAGKVKGGWKIACLKEAIDDIIEKRIKNELKENE